MLRVARNKVKQKILIADDAALNREILIEILKDDYEIVEASDGQEALVILQQSILDIDLLLLDINMPKVDGFEVLAVMNKNGWIDDVPVIIISAENTPSYIDRAYDLGVTDYISRPFDTGVVCRRVANTIMLYEKQKRLISLVADQIYEKEKNSNLLIAILSHIVEFRNGESGLHVLHINTMTEILLNTLVKKSDRYKISSEDIVRISIASSLHDIGKISIPEEILNKPGKLTKEEFEEVKKHTVIGAAMLEDLPMQSDEPLVKTAYEICRWHHERYDGRGYPDGLKGDEIPLSAQIVSLADVYDALTSERCYKKALPHDVALKMILNGECGAFNPLLLECLCDSAEQIKTELTVNSIGHSGERQLEKVTDEVLREENIVSARRSMQLLDIERMKFAFVASRTEGIVAEYSDVPPVLILSGAGAARLGMNRVIADPLRDGELLKLVSQADMENVDRLMRSATPEKPDFELEIKVYPGDEEKKVKFSCRTIWTDRDCAGVKLYGLVGTVRWGEEK